MWPDADREMSNPALMLDRPLVNAPGTLGFEPNPRRKPFISQLAAFVTNPISFRARYPAGDRAYLPFQGGYLLHTGLPNPGFRRVLSRYKQRWAAAPLPVLPHLLAETPESLGVMVKELEGLENIQAVEFSIHPDCDPAGLQHFFNAAAGELPIIPCLAPEQVPALLDTLRSLMPSAVHILQPRGTLPGADGRLVSGRLFGPAVYPVMLRCVQTIISAGLPVIASGGITDRQEIDAFLNQGVMAIGLDSVLWGVDPGQSMHGWNQDAEDQVGRTLSG